MLLFTHPLLVQKPICNFFLQSYFHRMTIMTTSVKLQTCPQMYCKMYTNEKQRNLSHYSQSILDIYNI